MWVKLTVGFRRAELLSLGLAAVKLSFPTFCRLAKVSWYAEGLDSASADSLLRHSDPPPLRSRLGPSSRSFPSKGSLFTKRILRRSKCWSRAVLLVTPPASSSCSRSFIARSRRPFLHLLPSFDGDSGRPLLSHVCSLCSCISVWRPWLFGCLANGGELDKNVCVLLSATSFPVLHLTLRWSPHASSLPSQPPSSRLQAPHKVDLLRRGIESPFSCRRR